MDKEQQMSTWLSRRTFGTVSLKPFITPVHRCPECNGILSMMGRAFRAPRQNEIEQWRKAEFLVGNGFKFFSSAGRYPDTLNQARQFVAAHRETSAGEKLARQIRNRPTQPGKYASSRTQDGN